MIKTHFWGSRYARVECGYKADPRAGAAIKGTRIKSLEEALEKFRQHQTLTPTGASVVCCVCKVFSIS